MTRKLKGKSIEAFRSKSFYMDGVLVSEHLMLFFNTDAQWYSVTITDGAVHIKREDVEPTITIDIDMQFSYPISDVSILKMYLGLNIESAYVYNISEIQDGIMGLYISYGDFGFSYYNIDDFSYIQNGLVDISPKKAALVEYELYLP